MVQREWILLQKWILNLKERTNSVSLPCFLINKLEVTKRIKKTANNLCQLYPGNRQF